MIALDEVTLRFGEVVALDAVSLAIDSGEIVALLGPSGSGKSTLLRVIAGLARPQAGRVRLDDVTVAAPGVFLPPERRRVGMVFQDYSLFPHLTVAANIAFGLRDAGRSDRDRRVAALLDRLDLSRHASRYPHVLSGGERQRVALARALAPGPRVLLMDEPFSSLDARLRDRVRAETVDLLRETGTTTIVVTHDPAEAVRLADRVALLHRGSLVQTGTAQEIYARPASVLAARLMSEVNELPGRCRGGCVETPFGTFAAPRACEAAAVRVCIRPEHLRVVPSGAGVPATVTATEFLGDCLRVSCALAEPSCGVILRAGAAERFARGETIFLGVEPSAVVVLPDQELSVKGSSAAERCA